ncbi:MAG: SH3 domain-containing protein [Pirellulales bacterium]
MSRTKLAAIAISVVLIIPTGPVAFGGDEEESGSKSNDVPVEVEVEVNEPEPAFLDVTLRLEFKLTPEEPEVRPLMVVCAGGDYEVGNAARGQDFEHALHISGELFDIDHENRFRLTFEAVSGDRERADSFEGRSNRRGSAILKLGNDTTLANIGEQTLVVTATLAVDEDDGISHVVTSDAEYNAEGPQQARPPDGTFPNGTRVSIIEEAGSYTLVRSENGISAYVATAVLRQLARD